VLVVTRRPRQTVKIGPDVSVTVLEIRGAQVRIGITAPPATVILRPEILGKPRPPQRAEPGTQR
jgi:carbon storage regulator